MKLYMDNPLKRVVEFVTTPVDVRDVAMAHLKAIEVGEAGDRFILTGSQSAVSSLEICSILRQHFGEFGYNIPNKTLPKTLITLGMLVSNSLHTRLKNVDCRYKVDNSKSIEKLGIEYRPLEETLVDMVEQLIKIGYIKNKMP